MKRTLHSIRPPLGLLRPRRCRQPRLHASVVAVVAVAVVAVVAVVLLGGGAVHVAAESHGVEDIPVAPETGVGLEGRELDDSGRLANFHFLHIPKTGTTFITVLRNYLGRCVKKDYTCNGWLGGSENPLDKGKEVPYIELTCHNRLIACVRKYYHAAWVQNVDGVKWNVATMIRSPMKQFVSAVKFFNYVNVMEEKEPLTVRQYLESNDNQIVKMLYGSRFDQRVLDHRDYPKMFNRARENLFKRTAFWGISDYWNTTICLFHKELNGPGPRDAEFLNTRAANTRSMETLKTLRERDIAFDPTTKESAELEVWRNYWDHKIFQEALVLFKERARRAKCPYTHIKLDETEYKFTRWHSTGSLSDYIDDADSNSTMESWQ